MNHGCLLGTREPKEDVVRNTIVFNASKDEVFTLSKGFKVFTRKLRSAWKLVSNEGEITASTLRLARMFVIAGPQEKFSQDEFDCMKRYVQDGGRLLVMMGEGGELKSATNINYFLEDFGINVNKDAVVRLTFLKYFHPKIALINDGVLNRAIVQATAKYSRFEEEYSNYLQSLSFVYPYGASLNVASPATAVLSTGTVCFPLNRPVCAFYCNQTTGGKIAVVGSVHIFSDAYIDKEMNSNILDVLLQFLVTDDICLNEIDAADPEISDYSKLPDIAHLAEWPKACLQENEELPGSVAAIFDSSLFDLKTNLVTQAVKAYESISVDHKFLTLIAPKFETPLPRFQPAVYPPKTIELRGPPLEFYDLDADLASERIRLAQVTNICEDRDLEFYARQCGEVLGVTASLPPSLRTARHILSYVFAYVVECKRQSPWSQRAGTACPAQSDPGEAEKEKEKEKEREKEKEKETPKEAAKATPVKAQRKGGTTTPEQKLDKVDSWLMPRLHTKLPPLVPLHARKDPDPQDDLDLFLNDNFDI